MSTQRPSTSQAESQTGAIITTAILVGGVILGWLYSLCLKQAKAAEGNTMEVMTAFLRNRLNGTPFTQAETVATVYFFIIFILLTTGTIVTWIRIKGYMSQKRIERSVRKRQASEFGTSELSRLSDIKPVLGNDGIVIGAEKRLGRLRPVRLSARYSYEHSAIIGPTGCGKSTCFFLPNLLMLAPQTSAVVTDPKGELEAETADYLRERGWEIYRFSPFAPERSYGYDPLRCTKNDIEITDIADIILKNGYDTEGRAGDTQWINFSAPLLEAVLYAAKQKKGNTAVVYDAVRYVTEYTEKMRAEEFKSVGGIAREKYMMYLQSIESPETASSIRTVLTSAVRIFARQDIRDLAIQEPVIDFTDLRKKPAVLFVQLPERKSHLLKPLMATFFWQLLEQITDTPGNPIFFFLDEFPNIGKIPGFAEMAATLRSRKISLNVGMQGVEQLAREYSEQEQKDILNNLKTKIFFPGSSGDSGEYVSSLSGYSTIKKDDIEQRVELLNAAELRTIPDGKILAMLRNYHPILLDTLFYKALL